MNYFAVLRALNYIRGLFFLNRVVARVTVARKLMITMIIIFIIIIDSSSNSNDSYNSSQIMIKVFIIIIFKKVTRKVRIEELMSSQRRERVSTRERERQTERQRETERETETDRQTESESCGVEVNHATCSEGLNIGL